TDRGGDHDLRPPGAVVQGEPGLEEGDERRRAGDHMTGVTLPDRLYFRIGEVARLLGVKPYVLRYWESEFRLVRPVKTEAQQRRYRRKDVETLLEIRRLLYTERYTIEGARRRLRESKDREGRALESLRAEIEALHRLVSRVPGRVQEPRAHSR